MQEILEINSRDLTGGELDYEVVDLEAGELNINTIDLDSGALETVTVDASRIIPLERDVAELKSRGNVRYDTAQELTEEQQTQARENIDAQESISDLDEIRSNAASGASKVSNIQSDWNATTGDAAILNKPNLSNVATSGNYNDLNSKPSIPSQLSDLSSDSTHRLVSDAEKSTWNSKQDAIDDLEDIRENASAGATAYQLPNGGIPSTDLDNNVQTSLGKADTAIQVEEDPVFSASAASGITAEDIASWNEHTSNIGTITGVSVDGTSIATSGVANISSVPASILEGTVPNGITAITQNQGDGSNKIATTSYVDTAINNLPDPMIFRGSLGTGGTITTLPTAASTNVGYTYKVIEDGTYANQSAKIGDTFISDGSAWILIPSGDEPSGTVTSIKIEATSPIVIDNDAAISTSGTRTLSHATSGVTAGTYRAVTVNNTGHVTAGTTEAIYILTTTWGNTASQCYLRSQYFLNSIVPTQKGDLILCRENGNLFKCGDLVYDSQEEVYYTNPTYLCNVLVAQGTSSQFVKGDGSLDSNTYAGSQTSGGAADKAVSIPFGQVDSTSTSTAFTATVDGITELRDGVCVYLRNGVVTSAANCTLNVNGLGAKPMYTTMNATTAVATHWNVNYTMLFIYNSTRVSGGCWDMYWGYYTYSNTIGYQLRRNNSVLPASDTSRYYKIFFTSADNTKWVPASADSTNNATSARAVNQRPINPFGPIEYLSTTTSYTAGTNIPASSLWQQYNVTLGYSFNRTGAALTLTTSKPVFIKCAPQDDGSAIIDANTPYVQDLPTTEDGKIYIFLGVAYSATAVEMLMVHPVYYYKNGSINLWTGTGTQTDVSKVESGNVIDIGGYDLMKINEVKGKSLVMNQRAKNPNPSIANNTEWRAYNNSNVSIEYVEDGVKATILNEGIGYSRGIVVNCTGIANTHKILAIITIKPSVTHDFSFETGNGQAVVSSCTANQWTKVAGIVTASKNDTQLIVKPATTNLSVNDTFTVRFASLVDLTQMFGEGNEPTTVEEVEAILGNDYYEYNTGEVVGNNVEKLDVTGFNIWDEEWEVGSYSAAGAKLIATDRIRCKNPIPVLPNTSYHFKFGVIFFLLFLDENQTGIGGVTQYNTDQAITSPSNAKYVVFYTAGAYGTTYNHDICINKSNTSKNGTYEPYKHSEFPLNLTELTGKVNGEGTSVTIFPDGMHGVGTAYDSLIVDEDGYARRAVKRMGSVDLGSLTWSKSTHYNHNRFAAPLENVYKKSYVPNIIDNYGYKAANNPVMVNDVDMTLAAYGSGIYLRNDTYENSTAEDFKTAMDGVMLYYELATPIEYVLDTPVQCVAKVYPNGTVKQVPVMPDSTPMVMDVTYLRDNGGMINGLMNKLASLEARIAALEGG